MLPPRFSDAMGFHELGEIYISLKSKIDRVDIGRYPSLVICGRFTMRERRSARNLFVVSAVRLPP